MKRRYWIAGLLTYTTCLLIFAPASTLPWAANRFAPFKIMAESSSGTLWRGEMRGIALTAKDKKTLKFGQCNWTLNPLWLLSGKLPIDFKLSGDSVRGNGRIVLGLHSLRFQQLDFSFPAALLAYVEPRLDMGQMEEFMNIRSDELLFQENHYQGRAEISWERAATSLSKIKPLGNYSLTTIGTGKTLQLQLQTRSGPLTLAGTGAWSPSGLQFNGSADPHGQTELMDLLKLFELHDVNGRYAISISSRQ